MKHILVLGAQHGNEPLGDMLRLHIYRNSQHLLPYITYKTANLRARRADLRFIDMDMNRSYGIASKAYEAKRAAHISKYINASNFDLVLDLHTTNCRQPASILTNGLTDEKINFLSASSIEKVIDMQHEIVKHSLIGVHHNAISIEISNHELGEPQLESLMSDIGHYINGEKAASMKELYVVKELLLKSSVPEDSKFENFEISSFGFIPILTGENSYKKHTDYLGFRAKEVVQINV